MKAFAIRGGFGFDNLGFVDRPDPVTNRLRGVRLPQPEGETR